jgi:hypothetical protein
MATTAKLIAATQAVFTSLMTTELNAVANGNAIRGSATVDNATNLDVFAEFSFVGGGSTTLAGAPFLSLYFYLLNGDGTTYGDGRFSTSAAGPPPASYFAGYMGPLSTGATTLTGTFARPDGQGTLIQLPRGVWRPVLYNSLGVAMAATGNVLYYRTTNYQFV